MVPDKHPSTTEVRISAVIQGEQDDEQDRWDHVVHFSQKAVGVVDFFLHGRTATLIDAFGNVFPVALPPSYRKGNSIRVMLNGSEIPAGPRLPNQRKARP